MIRVFFTVILPAIERMLQMSKTTMPKTTPNKNTAQTGWLIAATEGATVDGRTITKQWIEEMAETYSIEVYTAVIWPEHFRSSWGPFEGKNWGTIDAVKASKQGGKLRLFVKLTANSYLLDANKDGQKLFMSIEPDTDFTGTGKCYLQGLAVTDSPASTGTTRLKFSMGDKEIEHQYSALEVLEKSDFISYGTIENNSSKEEQVKTLFSQIFNLFSNDTNQAEQQQGEDDDMTEAQFNALMDKLNGTDQKFTSLEDKFKTLEEKVSTFSTSPGDTGGEDESGADNGEDSKGGDGKETTTETTTETKVTDDQFSALTNGINALTAKFGSLETKFNELSKETGDQEPDPAGQSGTISLV